MSIYLFLKDLKNYITLNSIFYFKNNLAAKLYEQFHDNI